MQCKRIELRYHHGLAQDFKDLEGRFILGRKHCPFSRAFLPKMEQVAVFVDENNNFLYSY